VTTIIAQISDPHIRLGPNDQGSAAALAKAVEAVLALDPLPDAVLISGDLADGGTSTEYERVRELLAPLPMPVHVLPGNHDRLDWDGPYAADVGELRLIACDTTIPGRDEGRLDIDWLEAQLAASTAPTIVAMHHPPLLTGIGGLDAIGLPEVERAALAALLARSPQVIRVAAGHVHRAAFGTIGGCPVVTCPGTNWQAKLEIGAEGFTIVKEPPAFVVHTADVAHLQPI
jgi:3',5'-cyclic-AMP phosphodiesterase